MKEDIKTPDKINIENDMMLKFPDVCYYFLVDRSASMFGQKIQITKEALKCFLDGLPPSSKFSIISFGTNFQYLLQEQPLETTV